MDYIVFTRIAQRTVLRKNIFDVINFCVKSRLNEKIFFTVVCEIEFKNPTE